MSACKKCKSVIPQESHKGHELCDDCLIEFQEYQSLLDEGYRLEDAAVRSGWRGAEEI